MKRDELYHLLAVARGDREADLLLRGGCVLHVFSGELHPGDVVIAGGRIAAVGSGYRAAREMDCSGLCLIPGLIDAHVHIESSMVTPGPFSRAVVPHGVTTVVADPHEIANVAGRVGIEYMMAASEGLPLDVLFMLPSCVPATPLGTAGAELDAGALAALRAHPRALGLGEFMNVPGAVSGLPDAMDKLLAFQRDPYRRDPVDGHAPGLKGARLQAYAAAGPSTDHECITAEEALEKVRAGFHVLIRESTGAHNLVDLLPAVTPGNARRFAFCTDDRHPADLLDEGSIDHLVRCAIQWGLDPVTAIRLATLNAAEAFGLRDRGAIAPGRRADIVALDSPESFRIQWVLAGGWPVSIEDGGHEPAVSVEADVSAVRGSVRVQADALDFRVAAQGRRMRVIGVVPDQLVTEARILDARIERGLAVSDAQRDVAKLAVIERHGRGGGVGLGFVQGLGLRAGAIAGSVGHDCHNVIVAGMDDEDMREAVRAVAAAGGGLAAVRDGQCRGRVPLPVAGLMSEESVEDVRRGMDRLMVQARALGSTLHDPFMQMGFLALEVIPALKLTDRGLVDVDKFEFVPLWV